MNKKVVSMIVAAAAVMSTYSFTAHAETVTSRYSGLDRYETASKVCQDGWKTGTTNAVIVNGENFPDALAAAPLAKKFDAPILLTSGNELNAYTSVEVNRLGVKNVYLIGGRGVISQGVEDALKARGIKVTRLGGADRYETAIQIAGKLGKTNQLALINGNDFRDGMSIAPIAAMKGMAVIPVEKDSLPSSVAKYLKSYKKADQIYVIGGQDKISDSVVEGLPNVKRIGGGDVYSSNVNILENFSSELNTGTVYIASAKDFPDALGASAIAAQESSPVLFVDNNMGSETERYLKTNIINKIKVLGGPASVDYQIEQIAKSLPLAVANTENINDTIWQNEKYTPRPTMIITASDGSKKEAAIEWNLTKVNTTKPGLYTFTGKVQGTDKTVFTTLIVKPLPYKIEDREDSARSRESYNLPNTIVAEMTDGSKSQVPVTWDYGTQQGNKPGVYVFYGTVDRYNKKVKLTLTISNTGPNNKQIKSISNIKSIVKSKSQIKLPNYVKAVMDDDSTQKVAVTWGGEKTYAKGVYVYEGTVAGYDGVVKYMFIVTDDGGVDPNDPNYPEKPVDPNKPDEPDNPDNPDNPDDNVTDIGSLEPIMQGEPYPQTIIDPKTKKPVQVTWTKAISINTDTDSLNDDSLTVDECRVAKVTLEGTIGGGKGSKKVKAEIGIMPKIVGITTVDNSSDRIVPVVIKIPSKGIYSMQEASDKLRALVKKPDGGYVKKRVKVLLWDPPYVDVGDSQNYYVRATIKNYPNTVMVTLQVSK